MLTALVVIFVVAYIAIALEHPLNINKAASALVGAGLLWTVYAVFSSGGNNIPHELSETLVGIAQIIFFLMGAMTIVELIDAHNGFQVVTSKIKTTKLSTLMLLVGVATFFLSAILDNLTTAIVMVSLMKKLLARREDRLWFAGIIIIAANAGGAWSPIGDVTTTMLWIGGQITPINIITGVFLPSLVNLLVPLLAMAFVTRGRSVESPVVAQRDDNDLTTPLERSVVFWLGLGVLIAVPVFKAVTHLPPFMGILFGLGILWLVADLMHRNKAEVQKDQLTISHAIKRIDMSSVIFFIGILLAVAVLEHTHILSSIATWLDNSVGRLDIIVVLIGLVSAIVDNVPLVAASMGMYSLEQYPPDSFLWEFLAYCAGTGGSILIIGSAAGVAAMGLEKIDFIWYLKKISTLALLGYLAGALVYVVQFNLLH
ncbi:MAG: sodium:proton antiporter NhaD [Cellvibrio sp.]|uniref:sodium:proton antiporter NhaD n=1 Tax=Cellvibrio sp. TaxID=1965322 RepID=UPI0031A27B88